MCALDRFPEHKVIITYPNADNGGRAIIPLLEAYAQGAPERVKAVPSLGFKRYLSAVALADAVVGNSSSGIIEVPAFAVPTVNIGARQDGRLAADSVLHCRAQAPAIEAALHEVLSGEFAEVCKNAVNPYGAGNASHSIASVLERFDMNPNKSFHDTV